jgi:hypothetical protein
MCVAPDLKLLLIAIDYFSLASGVCDRLAVKVAL